MPYERSGIDLVEISQSLKAKIAGAGRKRKSLQHLLNERFIHPRPGRDLRSRKSKGIDRKEACGITLAPKSTQCVDALDDAIVEGSRDRRRVLDSKTAMSDEPSSEERRVGKEGDSTCRYRWAAYH